MQRLKKPAIILLFISSFSFFSFRAADNYFEISKNLEIFASVVKEVNTYYVDEIEPATLLRVGIDAMLKSLDPYTDYYSESEVEDYRFMTTGQYGGIGASISKRGDYIMILEPYEGWAAQKADLRAGDVIMEIDGKSMKGKTTDEVSKLLKGQAESEIKMLIKRGDTEPFVKTFKRDEIKVKNVPYYGMINENIGYIKFTGFRQEAAAEVRNALVELKKNPKMTGLVLDLRGNPGGLLDEAIKAVNIFVDKGQLVVSTKGKMQEWNKEYTTESEATDTKLPLVVLTDGGSASAAEIVSGSLQDLDRAIVVGENTFGKGLVQTTRPLPYNTQMKITTSKYYIPSGRCIQQLDYSHKDENGKAIKMADSLKRAFKTKCGRTVFDGNGIKPDIEIERKEFADVVESLGEKKLFYDFANAYRAKHATIPAAKDFNVSDADFQEFLAFLKNKEYAYTTATEESLKSLETAAKEEKYYAALKADIETMQKKLHEDKREDVNKYKEDIKEILEEEIVARYYFQTGRVESSFDDDNDINEALQLFGNPDKYRKILSASK
ncbi:MAG: S41 family peptidase [Sphingobacteriales bacterium]|nr:MAG: S41 family peptidase [Sphingobacteriales bacterium]